VTTITTSSGPVKVSPGSHYLSIIWTPDPPQPGLRHTYSANLTPSFKGASLWGLRYHHSQRTVRGNCETLVLEAFKAALLEAYRNNPLPFDEYRRKWLEEEYRNAQELVYRYQELVASAEERAARVRSAPMGLVFTE
jgi:hypothetical protein